MENFARFLLLSFCVILTSCAASQGNVNKVSLDTPMSVAVRKPDASFHISVENVVDSMADASSMVTALLQSEHGMRLADSAETADYSMVLRTEKFGQIASESASMDGRDFVLPAVVGGVSGAQVGASINGGTGALWGLGIGLAASVGLTMALEGDTQLNTWQMITFVQVRDPDGVEQSSRFSVETQGEGVQAEAALGVLENEMARAIVHAFKNLTPKADTFPE